MADFPYIPGSRLPDLRSDPGYETAQTATGQFAEDTRRLIDLLTAVDFFHSQLSREILENLQPGTSICKLEYSVKVHLIGLLEQTRQRIRADIRPIDTLLMNLAQRFGAYVRNGDPVCAQMAHGALVRGIRDIRCNFPQDPAISHEQFVSINAEYLQQWINLVQWAEIYDRQSKNLAAQRRTHEQEVARLYQTIDGICTRIETNPDFAAAFFHILDHDTPDDRSCWTQSQREVHLMLVEQRINQLTLQMSNASLLTLEQDQITTRQKIDALHLQLSAVPIVTDPNLMNKFRESMHKFVRDLAASDAFIEETLRDAGALEGALKHLEEQSDAIRQHAAAAESARSILLQRQRPDQLRGDRQQDSHTLSPNHN